MVGRMNERKRKGRGNLMSPNEFGLPTADEIVGNKPKKKNKERDRRRSFTKTQKNEILYQQDNKCARCHNKLDPRSTEFDHEKPWASGGRTVVVNGRALCANCHKVVSHETRLKKVDNKPKSTKKKKEKNVWDLTLDDII